MTYTVTCNIENKSDAGAGDYEYHPTKLHSVEKINDATSNISTNEQQIDYTKFNKAEKITEGDYELNIIYGPENYRKKTELKENGQTITTRYYAGNYEKEITQNGTKEYHYISGPSGLIAVYIIENDVGELYYTITNYLGSILIITDKDGNIEEEANYDAWGRMRNPDNWTYSGTQPLSILYRGFTGHEMLPHFALINMNGRMYDPVLGRMLSPDNFVQDPGNPQFYNRYAYCLNNPLKYTDPSGEFIWAIVAFIVRGGYDLLTNNWQGWEGSGKPAIMWGLAAGTGYLGKYVASSGIPFANTIAIMESSTAFSGGMNVVTGGESDLVVSFGVGSYNLSQSELGGLWNWSDNTTMENIGYTFGAMANLQDAFALIGGGENITINSKKIKRKNYYGHSSVTNESGSIDISVGPEGYARSDNPLSLYKGVLQENYAGLPETWKIDLYNVNKPILEAISKNVDKGKGLFGIGKLKWNAYPFSCVNKTAQSLWAVGIPTLPINIHPHILNLQLMIRQYGIYSSPYLTTY